MDSNGSVGTPDWQSLEYDVLSVDRSTYIGGGVSSNEAETTPTAATLPIPPSFTSVDPSVPDPSIGALSTNHLEATEPTRTIAEDHKTTAKRAASKSPEYRLLWEDWLEPAVCPKDGRSDDDMFQTSKDTTNSRMGQHVGRPIEEIHDATYHVPDYVRSLSETQAYVDKKGAAIIQQDLLDWADIFPAASTEWPINLDPAMMGSQFPEHLQSRYFSDQAMQETLDAESKSNSSQNPNLLHQARPQTPQTRPRKRHKKERDVVASSTIEAPARPGVAQARLAHDRTFPHGSTRMPTESQGLLCALYAARASIAAQYSDETVPSIKELLDARDEALLGPDFWAENNFEPFELQQILRIWSSREVSRPLYHIGIEMPSSDPWLIVEPSPYMPRSRQTGPQHTARVLVLWVFNDDLARLSGGKYFGHYEGLRRCTSQERESAIVAGQFDSSSEAKPGPSFKSDGIEVRASPEYRPRTRAKPARKVQGVRKVVTKRKAKPVCEDRSPWRSHCESFQYEHHFQQRHLWSQSCHPESAKFFRCPVKDCATEINGRSDGLHRHLINVNKHGWKEDRARQFVEAVLIRAREDVMRAETITLTEEEANAIRREAQQNEESPYTVAMPVSTPRSGT